MTKNYIEIEKYHLLAINNENIESHDSLGFYQLKIILK